MIAKTAERIENFQKSLFFYNSARDAFRNILSEYNNKEKVTLLLPGYIGISPNEGSGIFDPVIDSGIDYSFYKIDKDFSINMESFKTIISATQNNVMVLLVHYFGYVDKNIKDIIEICRKRDAVIIEDAAHALYTDYVDNACGMYGDYVLYSLHKMLPFKSGGMLKVNRRKKEINITGKKCVENNPFEYDLFDIAIKRKANASLWNDLLKGHEKSINILRPYESTITPQTFPIIIKDYDRNQLYFKLNEAGYGAVSLYHTMIDQIKNDDNANAVWLSQHIINMPVHQDAEAEEIKSMARLLISIIEKEM